MTFTFPDGPGGPPTFVGAATTPSASPRPRRHPLELPAVRALIAAAALVAAFSPAAPTGHRIIDALWCAALAALVTWAASRSRRWPWLWLAGVATAAGIGSWWALAGFAALALAMPAVYMRARGRAMGALIGALAVQALLRLPDYGFHGLSALIVVVAVAPVLWSGYERSPSKVRHRVRLTALIGGGVVVVLVAVGGITMVLAEPQLRDGANQARAGLDLAGDGDPADAADLLASSAREFTSANDSLSAPWSLPARVVPVLSQHLDTLATASEAGADVADAAAAAAAAAPYDDLRATGGQVDLALVRSMQAPAADAARALAAADQSVGQLSTDWLVAPVAEAITDLQAEIADALPTAELTAEALGRMPALLGGEGERTYLVLFTSPAETRFLGGFVGSYALLTANDGALAMTEAGSIGDLAQQSPYEDRTLEGRTELAEYLVRHGRYQAERYFQNLTASPDLPTDATVAAELYRQTTGGTIDGVIVVDPFALAAFLEITGPVEVEGLDEPLTAENALDHLLLDQYVDFEGDTDERRDALAAASAATFAALTSQDLPGPRQLGRVLGPMVDQKHLLFWSLDPANAPLTDRLGTSGRFVVDAGADHLALRTANAGANKLDSFLHRSLAYDVAYDPATGTVAGTATITLRNDAPPTGLPDYVIGNLTGEPPGTNRMYLSLYSPLAADSATLDGAPIGLERQRELGSQVASTFVSVPAGGTVTLVIQLSGAIEPGIDYDLLVLPQPLVHDDQLDVRVSSSLEGWQPVEAEGMTVVNGIATASAPLSTDQRYTVRFGD
jgi:hypothetical protein